jgi:hypothetical protein
LYYTCENTHGLASRGFLTIKEDMSNQDNLTKQLEFIEEKYADNILKRKKDIQVIDQCILKFEEILAKNKVTGAYFYIMDEKPVTIRSLQFPVEDKYWETNMIFYGIRDKDKRLEYGTCKTDNQIAEFSYEGWYSQLCAQTISGRISFLINELTDIKCDAIILLPDFLEQILESFSHYTNTSIQIFRPTVVLDK